MTKYRKKPIVIEAMIFPDDGLGQCEVGEWVEENGGKLHLYDGLLERNIKTSTNCRWHYINGSIDTSEGIMNISIGDYIIKEPFDKERKFYPCKPDIFKATYEKI